MKKIIVALVMLSLLVFAGSSFATVVTIDRLSGYYYGNGGEFNINGYGPSSQYNKNKAIVNGGFETFCLEHNEYLSTLPGLYNAELNSNFAAIEGGNNISTGGSGYDIISIGTAYLYSQFAEGILSNYNYMPGIGREASAAQLQNAIWWLEDELTIKPSSYYITLVEGLFGEAGAKANVTSAKNYGVGVLNITTLGGVKAQDQLVLLPEPSIMLLLGFGLVGVGVLRRRK